MPPESLRVSAQEASLQCPVGVENSCCVLGVLDAETGVMILAQEGEAVSDIEGVGSARDSLRDEPVVSEDASISFREPIS